jgi:cytoskeleton protein RodZ
MSDTALPEAAPDSLGVERSPGVLIRKAREQRGLHIAALAAAMKVTPRKLEALEGDRWDELPDNTFVRALAQSVCRTLKVDPKPVLDLLPPAAPAMREVPARNLNANYSNTPSRDAGGGGESSMRPLVIAAGLLALAAAVMFALPASFWGDAVRSPAASAAAPGAGPGLAASAASGVEPPAQLATSTVPVAATPAGAAIAASLANATPPEAAASEPASLAGTAAGVAAQALATLGKPGSEGGGAASPALGSESAASAAGALPNKPNATLQLRTRETTWISVRDMRNRVIFDREVPAGSQIGLDGQAPLSVIIGNASATELRYKGKRVDLSARTRGNVARIDLP